MTVNISTSQYLCQYWNLLSSVDEAFICDEECKSCRITRWHLRLELEVPYEFSGNGEMFKYRAFVSQNFVGALFHKINPKGPGLGMLTDMHAQHEDFESPVYRRPEAIRCLVRVSSCVFIVSYEQYM
jgi:hypothetical protein